MMTLHILSRVATPHNNCLVRALRSIPGWRVVTWYAVRSDAIYGWGDELGEHPDTCYFTDPGARVELMRCLLFSPKQQVLFVGYTEPEFRILMLALLLRGRRFFYWTDHPQEVTGGIHRILARWFGYLVVRLGAKRVFVVGRHTVEWFIARGFRRSQLENFPIFIDLPPEGKYVESQRRAIRTNYGVPEGAFFLVSGSRLIREKSFDVLIDGVARLPSEQRQTVRVLIVGKGPERLALEQQAAALGLSELVYFEEWMSAPDFEAVIAAADAFVHPSRFDAFGGGTLVAMAAGVPVIGSDGAGAVVERVEEGVNGYIFPKDRPEALAQCLARFLDAGETQRSAMRIAARATAEKWTPEMGARRLHQLASSG
jgi:glycosyltransferase involved in cell wall biosynthesis